MTEHAQSVVHECFRAECETCDWIGDDRSRWVEAEADAEQHDTDRHSA